MRRRSDSILISLAMKVLHEAAYRSSSRAVGTIEVRLALRVLALFIGKHDALLMYWKQATVQPRHPWVHCHGAYRAIELALEGLGWTKPE